MIKMNKVSINEDSSGNLDSLKTEIKRLKSEIIILKNGTSSMQIGISNDESSQKNYNYKMIGVLQQYVDE